MNVEIGAEAALFPEKKYIKGIFVAVRRLFLMNMKGLRKVVVLFEYMCNNDYCWTFFERCIQYMINSILHTYWVQSDTSSCNGKSIVIRSVLASVIHIFYIVLFAVSD
jgi:hypothetical protein